MKHLLTIFSLFAAISLSAQEKKAVTKLKDLFEVEVKIGTNTFKDGSTYNGEMKGRKPYGRGKTIYPNGNTYEGEYVKGKREGKGTFSFADGERYEGDWYQDQQHGYGIYHFADMEELLHTSFGRKFAA